MKVSSVDGPDNESPDFLGVPAPESVPSLICPDSAGYQGEGPENEADDVELVREFLEFLYGWEDFEQFALTFT